MCLLAFAQIIPSFIKRFVIPSLLRRNNMNFVGYSIQNKVNNIAMFAKIDIYPKVASSRPINFRLFGPKVTDHKHQMSPS